MASAPPKRGRKIGAGIAPARRISSIIEQFVAGAPFAAGIVSAMEEARLKGDHEDAALMRLMLSWMCGMREGTRQLRERGLLQLDECSRMANSLIRSGRWRFHSAAESLRAEDPDLLMRVHAGSLIELCCLNPERESEFRAAAESVAAEANEAIWPASPFCMQKEDSSAKLCFDFVSAEAAIVCSAMSGSEWIQEWMAMGCPDLGPLTAGAGISKNAMLSRLWMDDAHPFSGSEGAELDRWRAPRAGGIDSSMVTLGDARSKGRGLGRAKGFILGLNLGAHLFVDPAPHIQKFGAQMLLNLAENGAEASVASALQSLVGPSKRFGMEPRVVLELLARVEAIGIGRQAGASASKPKARSL